MFISDYVLSDSVRHIVGKVAGYYAEHARNFAETKDGNGNQSLAQTVRTVVCCVKNVTTVGILLSIQKTSPMPSL